MIGRNYKAYNAAVIIYHFVCPAKYRNVVFSEALDMQIKEICLEIEKRYDIKFLEIGTDNKNVHFLVQTLPKLSPNQIIRTIKSIITDEIFERYPVVREKLWGGKLWSDEYYAASVSRYESQTAVKVYAENKGIEKEYKQLLSQPLIHPGNAALFSTDTSRLLPKIFLLHRSQGSADNKLIYRVKHWQSSTHPNIISELTEHREVQRAENQGQAKSQDLGNNEFARNNFRIN
jgi:putative transposase